MGIFSLMIWGLVSLTGLYIYRFLGGISAFLCRHGWLPVPYRRGERLLVRAIRMALAVGYVIVVGLWWRMGAILVLHLALLSLLTGLCLRLAERLLRRRERLCRVLSELRGSRVIALLLTVLIGILGAVNMQSVRATEYTVTSPRITTPEGYTVAFLSDIHYGTIQEAEVLEELVEELNTLDLDLVILGGDLLEEGSDKQEMQALFLTLGGIRTQYGIYYIYGNHDRQFYSSAPAYTPGELAATARTCGITVLCDEAAAIGEELLLVGREDLSRSQGSGRTPIETITAGEDPNRFLLVADHQPSDFSASVTAGADLQLSGHTHAGQIFPGSYVLELFGGYAYGEYREGSSTLIVSSGVAGWGFPFRTEKHCEYALVRLTPKQ